MSFIDRIPKTSVSRKAPYRKQKTLSPQEFREFLQQENISGYPADVSNIQISCSTTFCASVTAAKTAMSWGRDFVNTSDQTRVPKGLTDVVQVATVNDYTVALKGNGDLFGWGNNKKAYYNLPVTSGVERIVGGGENFIALLGDGNLVGWGNFKFFNSNDIPDEVYSGSPIVSITMGFYHAAALLEDGTIICWGNAENNHLEVPFTNSKFVDIKAYNEFTLGLKEDGTLAGWGIQRYGQQNIPLVLTSSGGSPVVSFAVGKYHCAAITEDGKFYTWGWDVARGDIIRTPQMDDYRRVTMVELDPRTQKYLIEPPREAIENSEEKAIKVFAGNDVTFVLMDSGDVIGWGDEIYDLIKIPEIIPPLERPGQPNIDLRPYGLKLDIDSIIQGNYIPSVNLVATISKDTSTSIETRNGVYRKLRKMGEGAYGKVYEVEKNGAIAVVKVQKMKRSDSLPNLFLETALQIIIQEESKRLNAGFKVCPDIYEIGFNPTDKTFYIFQEKIDVEMKNDFIYNASKFTAGQIADILTQIAVKLNWLYDNLEFNHRDMKSDNIMFKMDPEGNRQIYFIDFGLSCLTYRGIRVKTKNYFQQEKCFEETRDMTFLLYDIYTLDPRMFPKDLGDVIRGMLYFKVKGQPCNMVSGRCDGKKLEFRDMYDELNLSYVFNPNATTDKVVEKMAPFLE